MSSEKASPQHLHFINSRLRWDWRKEDAVELIFVVFFLTFFFFLPRQGCGISEVEQASANAEGVQQLNTMSGDGAPE